MQKGGIHELRRLAGYTSDTYRDTRQLVAVLTSQVQCYALEDELDARREEVGVEEVEDVVERKRAITVSLVGNAPEPRRSKPLKAPTPSMCQTTWLLPAVPSPRMEGVVDRGRRAQRRKTSRKIVGRNAEE